MKNLTPQDIETGGSECIISFRGLTPDYENEEYTPVEPSKKEVQPLTAKEIIAEYDVSAAVAEKLVAYQSGMLLAYQDEVARIVGQVDRYNEIKPYVENSKLDKDILSQYVASTMNHKAMLKEFRPSSHLRNGLIGVTLSCTLFLVVTVMGWNANPPTGFDFVSLGIVAFIWLGITITAAWQIPSRYRARKIVYAILQGKQNGR